MSGWADSGAFVTSQASLLCLGHQANRPATRCNSDMSKVGNTKTFSRLSSVSKRTTTNTRT
jgi:hypothetical protein